MTTRRVTSLEVSIEDEPLARVHLVATLVDPDHLLPMRNFFSGKSIQPDVRVTAESDDSGMISIELVRNDVMTLDSRYLIETWIEREDGTRTPRRAHVIYIEEGEGDLPLDDLTPSTPHTPPPTPTTDRRVFTWGASTRDAPTAIPAGASESTTNDITITLASDAYAFIAQDAARADISMLLSGGFDVLSGYEKGATTFDHDGVTWEYWVSVGQLRSGSRSYQIER